MRASARLATNLNSMSQEMQRNEPNAEEIDAIKITVISWVEEYERILEEAQPAIERRDEDVTDAFEDREEEAEETVERMLEDFESNDQMFDDTVTEAQAAMETELENNGVVADAEDLGQEIDSTLTEIERSMFRFRRHASSLVSRSSRGSRSSGGRSRSSRTSSGTNSSSNTYTDSVSNTPTYDSLSDAMTEELPSGAEVHAAW